MEIVKKATTDKTVYLFIPDYTQSDGSGLAGLVYNSSGLTCYYVRNRGLAVAIPLVTLSSPDAAHADGGFKEVEATYQKGVYRLDLPDAVCASGVDGAVVYLQGAANMAPVVLRLLLVDYTVADVLDAHTYQAKVWVFDDDANVADRYVTIWHKDGQALTSGITSPTIQVFKSADGSDLVASSAMTQIAATGTYRYVESTNRMVTGVAYVAKVQATIDGSTRTWFQPVGRDSA
jgi:hypothetical protein